MAERQFNDDGSLKTVNWGHKDNYENRTFFIHMNNDCYLSSAFILLGSCRNFVYQLSQIKNDPVATFFTALFVPILYQRNPEQNNDVLTWGIQPSTRDYIPIVTYYQAHHICQVLGLPFNQEEDVAYAVRFLLGAFMTHSSAMSKAVLDNFGGSYLEQFTCGAHPEHQWSNNTDNSESVDMMIIDTATFLALRRDLDKALRCPFCNHQGAYRSRVIIKPPLYALTQFLFNGSDKRPHSIENAPVGIGKGTIIAKYHLVGMSLFSEPYEKFANGEIPTLQGGHYSTFVDSDSEAVFWDHGKIMDRVVREERPGVDTHYGGVMRSVLNRDYVIRSLTWYTPLRVYELLYAPAIQYTALIKYIAESIARPLRPRDRVVPVGAGKKQGTSSSLPMEVDFLSETPGMIGPFTAATDSYFVLENKQLDKTKPFPKNSNDSGIAIVSIFSPTDRWLDSLNKSVADALQAAYPKGRILILWKPFSDAGKLKPVFNLHGFDACYQILCDPSTSAFLNTAHNHQMLSQMFTFMKDKYIQQQPTPKKLNRDVTVLVRNGVTKDAFDTSLRDKMVDEGGFTLIERGFDESERFSHGTFNPERPESPLIVAVPAAGGRWLAGPLRRQLSELSDFFTGLRVVVVINFTAKEEAIVYGGASEYGFHRVFQVMYYDQKLTDNNHNRKEFEQMFKYINDNYNHIATRKQ